MDVSDLLQEKCDDILAESCRLARRADLSHYRESGAEMLRLRLKSLLELTIRAAKEHELTHMVKHAEKIAGEHFVSGYDLSEVQTAFNVLEETLWKVILKEMKPKNCAEALAQVSMALGAGKDALARVYVSLACETHKPFLDLRSTFEGTDAPIESW